MNPGYGLGKYCVHNSIIRFIDTKPSYYNEIMVTVTNREVAEKLERLRREGENLNDVIKRIVETYEELMDYIDEKWEKLQRDKKKFIDIEDYASLRDL